MGPVYIRLGRLAVESVHNNDDYRFELGKGITLRDGKDITIIATGLLVQEAVKAAKSLEEAGIDARVIDIHTIKPLDQELVLKALRRLATLWWQRGSTSSAAWGGCGLLPQPSVSLPSPRSASTTHSAIPALLWTC